jgi:tetratricopeptide (TPR) repeat protein
MLKQPFTCLLLLGLALFPGGSLVAEQGPSGTASSLNSRGYHAYKAGEFSKALDLFKQAVKADPTYGQAHYNLACTLGVLRQKEGACGEHEVYLEDIIHSLHKTLKYLPLKRDKMLADPDLTPVYDTFAWQKIRGLSVTTTDEVKQILVAVSWFGPAPGAFGPIGGFDFLADGTFSYWYLDLTSDEVVRKQVTGEYEVSGSRVKFTFDIMQEKSGSFEGTLTENGLLILEGEGAPEGPYSADRSDCSA